MRTLLTFTLAATMLLPSCGLLGIGATARDTVLLPSLQASYPSIQVDIAYVADEAELANAAMFGAALESGDITQIAAAAYLWPDLEQLAQDGIEQRMHDGLIGTGVALSLQHRLENFENGLYALGVLTVVPLATGG